MIEFTDDDFVSARRGLLGDESASSASEENVLAGTVLRGENEELTPVSYQHLRAHETSAQVG